MCSRMRWKKHFVVPTGIPDVETALSNFMKLTVMFINRAVFLSVSLGLSSVVVRKPAPCVVNKM